MVKQDTLNVAATQKLHDTQPGTEHLNVYNGFNYAGQFTGTYIGSQPRALKIDSDGPIGSIPGPVAPGPDDPDDPDVPDPNDVVIAPPGGWVTDPNDPNFGDPGHMAPPGHVDYIHDPEQVLQRRYQEQNDAADADEAVRKAGLTIDEQALEDGAQHGGFYRDPDTGIVSRGFKRGLVPISIDKVLQIRGGPEAIAAWVEEGGFAQSAWLLARGLDKALRGAPLVQALTAGVKAASKFLGPSDKNQAQIDEDAYLNSSRFGPAPEASTELNKYTQDAIMEDYGPGTALAGDAAVPAAAVPAAAVPAAAGPGLAIDNNEDVAAAQKAAIVDQNYNFFDGFIADPNYSPGNIRPGNIKLDPNHIEYLTHRLSLQDDAGADRVLTMDQLLAGGPGGPGWTGGRSLTDEESRRLFPPLDPTNVGAAAPKKDSPSLLSRVGGAARNIYDSLRNPDPAIERALRAAAKKADEAKTRAVNKLRAYNAEQARLKEIAAANALAPEENFDDAMGVPPSAMGVPPSLVRRASSNDSPLYQEQQNAAAAYDALAPERQAAQDARDEALRSDYSPPVAESIRETQDQFTDRLVAKQENRRQIKLAQEAAEQRRREAADLELEQNAATIDATAQRLANEADQAQANRQAMLDEANADRDRNAGIIPAADPLAEAAAERAVKREELKDDYSSALDYMREGGLVKRQGYMTPQPGAMAAGGLAAPRLDEMNLVNRKPTDEVRPAGTEEEIGVADDLPRNLSEGEFVIPAHVVRQYGEDFFNDLIGSSALSKALTKKTPSNYPIQ